MNWFLYVALTAYFTTRCDGENMFNRVFRQVAQTINYDRSTSDQEEGGGGGGSGGSTAAWNPLNWFIPKTNAIPYNPDTDLGTVRSFT